jgi:hypothetical protein
MLSLALPTIQGFVAQETRDNDASKMEIRFMTPSFSKFGTICQSKFHGARINLGFSDSADLSQILSWLLGVSVDKG